MRDQFWRAIALALASLTVVLGGNVAKTTPSESLYDITLYIETGSQCTQQDYNTLCSSIPNLEYKQCAVWNDTCGDQATLRISFSNYMSIEDVRSFVSNIPPYKGITITNAEVTDVNECQERTHTCSKNGYCTNLPGAYRCQCGFGYKEPESSTALPGTFCVARCNLRSCRNAGTCIEAADEDSEVRCQCNTGYMGDTCQTVNSSSLPQWGIILIAVVAGISALVGISLLIFTCYRLFSRRVQQDDDFSDTNSYRSFKPKNIPSGEYERMTDLGSWSRANRGFASTIDEESVRGASAATKNDRLKLGAGLMSSRLSIPSEHGDPTPPLNPFIRTERHNASDITSSPDYY